MNVHAIFDQLINDFENSKFGNIDRYFCEDAELFSSALGHYYGIDRIKEVLESRKVDADILKVRVFNYVTEQIDIDTTLLSAYTVILIGRVINGFLHLFQTNFINLISFDLTDDKWRIKSLHSNMTLECGNSLLVSPYWNLIDYSKLNGNDENILLDEKGPLDHLIYSRNEEEEIKKCFFRYCWYIDNQRFDKLGNVYEDPFEMKNEKLKDYESGNKMSLRDSIDIFKKQRAAMSHFSGIDIPKEAVWNHIAHFEKLDIHADTAEALIYRYEPNRISTRFLHVYNYKTIYYSGVWKIGFTRNDSGIWKIRTFEFVNGITEDLNESDRRYF